MEEIENVWKYQHPITAIGFSAMFTLQLDNIDS